VPHSIVQKAGGKNMYKKLGVGYNGYLSKNKIVQCGPNTRVRLNERKNSQIFSISGDFTIYSIKPFHVGHTAYKRVVSNTLTPHCILRINNSAGASHFSYYYLPTLSKIL